METLFIEVEARQDTGKGAARRSRRAGRIPAVFYGPKCGGRPIALETRQFTERVARLEGSHLIELRSQDPGLDRRKVLLREIQLDPINGAPLHADLYEVALDKPIEVKVPLHFEGKATGVTLGGILQPILREVAVRCLPTRIPEFIAVDVTQLGIHDSIHVNDLKLPEGAVIASEDNEPVVTVLAPIVEAKPVAAEEAAEGAAAAGAASPEGEPAEPAKKTEPKKAESKKGESKK